MVCPTDHQECNRDRESDFLGFLQNLVYVLRVCAHLVSGRLVSGRLVFLPIQESLQG
jgi:hypothetical protein